MKSPILPERDRPVLANEEAIVDGIAKMLWEFEGNGDLYHETAEKIVTFVLAGLQPALDHLKTGIPQEQDLEFQSPDSLNQSA